MKSIESIKEETKNILLEVLPTIRPEDLSDEISIFSLGLVSIDAIRLLEKLENTFDIKFSNNEISFETFQNLKTLAELVEKKC